MLVLLIDGILPIPWLLFPKGKAACYTLSGFSHTQQNRKATLSS